MGQRGGSSVLAPAGIKWSGRWTGIEQSAAQLQFVFADSIGQEAELADADQTSGQHMQQEASHELHRIQRHSFGPVVVSVVFPFKADAAVFESAKAVVGDGHTVGIASQILENPLRSAKGRLDVNHPFDLGCVLTQGLERGRLSQRLEFTGEAECTLSESLPEVAQEGFAEAATEEAHGEKEGRLSAPD